MLRYYVEYLPDSYTDLTRYFFMYAYSEEQIKEMMKDYELVSVVLAASIFHKSNRLKDTQKWTKS